MNNARRISAHMLAATILLAGSGCSGMSERSKNTALGATAGGVAGAVLTGGGTLGVLGGAAVGGIIGNEVTKDQRKK